jgi:lipoyl(octanoyl) transferase
MSPDLLYNPVAAGPVLSAYLLGTVEFESALALQRLLAYQAAGDRDRAALVLCEHPPLLTVGRHGSRAHVLYEPEELQLRGWPVRWVNRGGGCLLHLPGQLAVYPVVALDRIGLGVRDYVARLEEVLRAVLSDFGVRGEGRPGRAGVWVGGRLAAAVGVAVRDWVAYYGAWLNINPDLSLLRPVRWGGLDGIMTSLERERHGPVRSALVRERLLEQFASHFGFARTALFTSHPALTRKSAPGAVAASP